MRLLLILILSCCIWSLEAQELSELYKGLKFRNIGPSRGGRSVASCGVIGDAMTYYMGSTGGGLWKTTDAGVSWQNISDEFFKMGSVGAVEVAPSDPNVIYVGMGEHPIRGVMTSHGDGMYKSTDAGKTWAHIGLPKSRHIAEIQIHPNNPDVAYVAVQGAAHGATQERGIYRTIDGGKTWDQILFIDENTGCADLSMDHHNPRILYAGMWDHRRLPWQVRSGGPGSGLYKSTDGGDTWTQLEEGLPEGLGKVAIDVSPANSEVVYANIEAEGKKAGVYRSDDAGETWRQTTSDRVTVARSWYYIEIFADPKDENKVYVLNAPMLKSIDGGKTFKTIQNPHGDQHHLWINPDNTSNIILSNDGGACVTFNGGKTWSSQQNQITIQFYRVITDERVPYYIYGGQQDNSTIAAASRSNGGGLGWKDWYPVSGCESAFIAFDDPKNPQQVYGGCYQGNISVYDAASQTNKDIIAYPTAVLAWHPADMKYRFNWNSPIVANPFDGSKIYHCSNKVLKTVDGGISWSEISPDLTRNDSTKQIDGGTPYTKENVGGEVYNTISYMSYSPHEDGTMYTGSDCGKVYLTRNEGADWTDVTPSGLPEALVNAIDISTHDAATAYIAVTRYKFNDMSPMIYKTTNYGTSWSKISNGIPDDTYVRVVREDPKVPNLLYAGTEKGLYMSGDGGKQWHNIQLNLPTCPITDLTFADNDLIVATSGRSFWVLDDLSALQAMAVEDHKTLTVIEPKASYALQTRGRRTGGLGENHPGGVNIDYYLPEAIDSGELKLEIYDEDGELVRAFSSEKEKIKRHPGSRSPEKTLTLDQGLNRYNWDLTKESLPSIEDVFLLGGYQSVPVSPGSYKAIISYGDTQSETMMTILADPNLNVSQQDYEEREAFIDEIAAMYGEMTESVKKFISVKEQLQQRQEIIKDIPEAKEMHEMGTTLLDSMKEWESTLIQRDQKTFQDVINFPNRLNAELASLISRSSGHDPRITAGARQRKVDLSEEWSSARGAMENIINDQIAKYNKAYRDLGLDTLIID